MSSGIRPFTALETLNDSFVREKVSDCSYLTPTRTGLEKSIMDAIGPLRDFLKRTGLHDYAEQPKGTASKVKIPAVFLTDTREIETDASLYRPETKNGDPRIWISGLRQQAKAGELLLLFVHERRIHVINLTASTIWRTIEERTGDHTTRYLHNVRFKESSALQELIDRLKRLALGKPLRQVCAGDTAIGRTIETALGIAMNPNTAPDYKGIELKSKRSLRKNRSTLFGQVPDWAISKIKSSREMLETFGYMKNGIKQLNVTVRAKYPNPQGLFFEIDSNADLLHESSVKKILGPVVTWKLEKLRARLLEKHKETVWIEADSTIVDGVEVFKLTKAVHTRAPILGQLEPLILAGHITMDHLINSRRGTDRGPLFKITADKISSLFGTSTPYALS